MLKKGELAFLKSNVGQNSGGAYIYNHPVLGFEIDKILTHDEPVVILEVNEIHKSVKIMTSKNVVGWIDTTYLKKAR